MKCVTTDARGNCNYLPVDVNEKKCVLYCTWYSNGRNMDTTWLREIQQKSTFFPSTEE